MFSKTVLLDYMANPQNPHKFVWILVVNAIGLRPDLRPDTGVSHRTKKTKQAQHQEGANKSRVKWITNPCQDDERHENTPY